MSNLLDKASIILTPTAYNNGEALCVKPSDGSGDFDFSRNSAATRVNAQGLVENVQILSSNLVQNGDFSEEGVEEVSNGSFSQEGAELVTNGNFDTDSDWHVGSGVNISDGRLNIDFVGAGNTAFQGISFTSGSTSKVVVVCSSYTSGILDVRVGTNAVSSLIDGVGTYTFYIKEGGYPYINFFTGIGFNGSIESVSVREVGQDWTLGTGWSIGEDKVVKSGTDLSYLTQSSLSSVVGKTYRVKASISNMTTGNIRIDNFTDGTVYTSDVEIDVYYTATSVGNFRFLGWNGFDGSITNISVKEVGQNWNLGYNWSIGNGVAICNVSSSFLSQNNILLSNKKYKISFEITEYISGEIRAVSDGYLNTSEYFNSLGVHDFIFNCGTLTSSTLFFQPASFNGSVTNISAIQITDDTNLPRINYEGFSYQDALGSELVVNGSFEDGLTDWTAYAGTISIETNIVHSGTQSAKVDGVGIQQSRSYTDGEQVYYNFWVYSTTGTSVFIQTINENVTIPLNQWVQVSGIGTINGNNSSFRIRIANGLWYIDNVSVKEYLGQEVVPDSGCGSWLFEPQSTNLLPYSSDFSQWSKVNYTVQSNVAVSPSGNFDASFVTNPSGGGGLINQTINVTSSTAYTFSFYAKRGTASDAKYSVYDYTNGGDIIPPTSYYSQINSDTFTRITVSFTAPVGCTSLAVYVLRDNSAVGNTIVWGAQVEALSYPTSYIPTDGSTVTRNQDVCNNGGSLASINSTEGVLYAEISTLNGDSGSNRTISLSDSTNGNQIRFYFPINIEGQIKIRVDVGGSTIYIFDYNITTSETPIKLAFRYSPNGMDFYGNGSLVSSSALVPSFTNNLNSLQFRRGDGQSGEDFFGKTKALAVWKEALSDAELTELTTI